MPVNPVAGVNVNCPVEAFIVTVPPEGCPIIVKVAPAVPASLAAALPVTATFTTVTAASFTGPGFGTTEMLIAAVLQMGGKSKMSVQIV